MLSEECNKGKCILFAAKLNTKPMRGGEMSNSIRTGVLALAILIFAASGIIADTRTETFALSGTGSFMDHPPWFEGDIISGTLSPGTFWVAFNDDGWPADDPGTSNNERWDYIFSHYFTYDDTPDAEAWDGYFPPPGSGEPVPTWRFFMGGADVLGGTFTSLVITIRDGNGNGIMEENEYLSKDIAGNFVAWINFSDGFYSNYCGMGNFSGKLDVVTQGEWEEELYVPSETSASGRLYLRDFNCSVSVESNSWGEIKSIYKD